VNVKTAARYIRAAQAAGLDRGGGEGQLTDELIGVVVGAVRPARPAGHGSSWELLFLRSDEVTAWVKRWSHVRAARTPPSGSLTRFWTPPGTRARCASAGM
jgi:hypothetical protein